MIRHVRVSIKVDKKDPRFCAHNCPGIEYPTRTDWRTEHSFRSEVAECRVFGGDILCDDEDTEKLFRCRKCRLNEVR